MELIIEAKYYSYAYVVAEKKLPGCLVKSISEIVDRVAEKNRHGS